MADNNVVDARGRSCPEPVILTKKALSKNGNKGLKVSVTKGDGEFKLTIG